LSGRFKIHRRTLPLPANLVLCVPDHTILHIQIYLAAESPVVIYCKTFTRAKQPVLNSPWDASKHNYDNAGINSANAKLTAERSTIFKPLGRAFMIS
jgi:hypothetical protein